MTRTYLFAGASSEIAKTTALQLRKEGHKIIGLTTKQNILEYDDCFTIEKYQEGYYPAIEEQIDGLVYFPGTIVLKPFNRITEQEFLNDYQINAIGAVSFVQGYLNNIKKSQVASIVFVSSVAAKTGMPFHASIAMAKGALESLTRTLAAEYAPTIRVNAVAPSLTNTPLGARFINSPEKLEAAQKRHPLRKIGNPEDISAAIAFLLTAQSSFVTGQVLNVDGGMSTIKL